MYVNKLDGKYIWLFLGKKINIVFAHYFPCL